MISPANLERFSGFAGRYDASRPRPPAVLLDILVQLSGNLRPHLVVDLGSGTGLSTIVWAERADEVIGVEPNRDMRGQAQGRAAARNVRYVAATASQTGLPDECADIVTCSQSLHWMEPEPTFAEVARILRPGGLFAAYDCDWPPTVNWEAGAAWDKFDTGAEKMGEERGWYKGVQQWAKEEHLARMQASGRFRYAKEIVLHGKEMGNSDRFVELMLSQGGVATLLKHGMSEQEIGLDEFRAVCERTIGPGPVPIYFSYRVRFGIK